MRPADPFSRSPATPAGGSRGGRPEPGARPSELARTAGLWSSEIPAFSGIYWALMRTGDVELVRLAPALEGVRFQRIGQSGSENPNSVVVAWSGPVLPPRPAR